MMSVASFAKRQQSAKAVEMTNHTRLSREYLTNMRRRAIWAEADMLNLPAFATPLWRQFYGKEY